MIKIEPRLNLPDINNKTQARPPKIPNKLGA